MNFPIEKYYDFNAKKFLTDYWSYLEEKNELEAQLATFDGTKGIKFGVGSSSGKKSDLSNIVTMKERTEQRLQTVGEYFALVDRIKDSLPSGYQEELDKFISGETRRKHEWERLFTMIKQVMKWR